MLFRRFAIATLSRILNVDICYKRSNGVWKLYEPDKSAIDEIKSDEQKLSLLKYLHDSTIYLYEFRIETTKINLNKNNQINVNSRNFRLLLDKSFWKSKTLSNYKVCMRFAKFNDADELKKYVEPIYCIDPKQIFELICTSNDRGVYDPNGEFKKMICLFLSVIPANNNNLSTNNKNSDTKLDEYSEIEVTNSGNKSIENKLEQMGKEKLLSLLAILLANNFDFEHEFITSKYTSLIHLLNQIKQNN
jgi:hypothetical protein